MKVLTCLTKRMGKVPEGVGQAAKDTTNMRQQPIREEAPQGREQAFCSQAAAGTLLCQTGLGQQRLFQKYKAHQSIPLMVKHKNFTKKEKKTKTEKMLLSHLYAINVTTHNI